MKNKKHNNPKESERTPIIDGDTRPDQNIEPQPLPKGEIEEQKKKKEFTPERGRDVNSLEDFKDKKIN
jgi:hypothetical protein